MPTPSSSDILARARALVPLIESEADAAERERKLSPAVVEAIRKAELFWMTTPESLGGMDTDLVTVIEVLEEISCADGSTGWSLMANCLGTGAAAASLPEGGIEAMFRNGERAVHAGMAAANGKGEIVPGGYRVQGNYGFASGSDHATWISAGFFAMDNGKRVWRGQGQPEIIVALLPKSRVKMKPNWDVMGLVGTGSHDYEVPEQLIESHLCYSLWDPPKRGRGSYFTGVFGIGSLGHGAVVLGMAKRALREAARLTRGKKRLGYPQGVSEHPLFQYGFGHHEAMWQAARGFLVDVFADAQRSIDKGDPITKLQEQRFRQVCAYAHTVASDVINFCYRAGGATALRNPSVLGRCMRDLHGATQHVTVDPVTLAEATPAIQEYWAGSEQGKPGSPVTPS